MTVVHLGASLTEEAELVLANGCAHCSVVRPSTATTSNLEPAPTDPTLLEADAAFGQPAVETALAAPRLRWIHLNSAGYSRYAEPDVSARLLARGIAITTSSSVYAEPCATHALTLTLALIRELPAAAHAQHGARDWPAALLRSRARVLADRRVVVLGYGAIGRRLLELLRPFGAAMSVVRATPRGDESVPTFAAADADIALRGAEIVIDTLPESPETWHFLSASRLSLLAKDAVVVNVGRGTTIDTAALAEALETGGLGGAALDVTDPEPLPVDHPLWSEPRCLITPHIAGGRAEEMVELARHFLANLSRFERGEALLDRVI